MPARMTPADQAKHARESLRISLSHGWDDARCREYAAEALRGQGVPIAEARAVVQRVWDERFRVWGAV